MGFLSGLLSPGLTAASQAVAGQQQGDIQGFLEKRKLDQAEAAASLKVALEGTQMRNMNSEIFAREHPKPTYDSDRGVTVDVNSGTSKPVAGIEPKDKVGEAVAIAKATKPIPTYGDLHPKPDQALVQTQAPDGSVIYTPRGEAAGMHAPSKAGQGAGNLPAPLAAKVGQAGEMIKKAYDLLPRMDALDVDVPESAAQDVAQHGIGIGHARIPGTQGVGSLLLNRTAPYSTYQAALSPFILAAAHALSGARINQDQVEQIRHSIEYKPGDSREVKAQKRKNMIDLVNSISGSLPAGAIAEQEDQMDPGSIALLKGYGYRGAKRSQTPPPSQAPSHTGASDPGGDIHLGKESKPSLSQTEYDAGIAKGHSDAEIASHYDLSAVRRQK